jgi:hypothetical protein
MIYNDSIQLIAWFSLLKDWILLVIYFLDTTDVSIYIGYLSVIYGYS